MKSLLCLLFGCHSYKLRCKAHTTRGNVEFELEVCQLRHLDLRGAFTTASPYEAHVQLYKTQSMSIMQHTVYELYNTQSLSTMQHTVQCTLYVYCTTHCTKLYSNLCSIILILYCTADLVQYMLYKTPYYIVTHH